MEVINSSNKYLDTIMKSRGPSGEYRRYHREVNPNDEISARSAIINEGKRYRGAIKQINNVVNKGNKPKVLDYRI